MEARRALMEELPTLGSEFSEQLLLFHKAACEESNHPNVFGAKFAAQVRWMLIGPKVADSLPEVGCVPKFEPAIGKGNYVEHGLQGRKLETKLRSRFLEARRGEI